jgi:hypothetical protein
MGPFRPILVLEKSLTVRPETSRGIEAWRRERRQAKASGQRGAWTPL